MDPGGPRCRYATRQCALHALDLSRADAGRQALHAFATETVRAANAEVVSSPMSRVGATAVSLRSRLCRRGARKEVP
jgi:hypothetical protein